MIETWRISKRRYAAFSGEGARLYGGRFNPPGVAVVYTAATLSLAALEYFIHVDPDLVPEDLVAIPARIPPSVKLRRLEVEDLPTGWREYPAPEELQSLGEAWVEEGKTAVLAVPSVVIPRERNYVFNPHHPQFGRVEIGEPEPFSFDPRMWKL